MARGGIGRPKSREGRKPRTSIPLGDKIASIDIKDAGYTWAQTLDVFRLHISTSAARNIYRNKDEYKRRAAAAEDLLAPRLRRSYFDSISQSLWDWYKDLQRVSERRLQVSGGLLEDRSRRIAAEQGVAGFKGSPHFIQNWANRHGLRNVALWVEAGSADVVGAAERISEIRAALEAYPVERIHNMDETGLF